MKIRLAVAMTLFSAAATAQQAPFDPIEARQAGFDQVAAIMDGLKTDIASKGDPKAIAEHAKALARWARVVPTLFPAGSDTGHNTKAKPDIWSSRAGFDQDAADLAAAADKLADAAARGDQAALADAFKATGTACGQCHRTYRVKSN